MSWLYKKEKKQHKTVYRILGLKISVKHSEEKNLIMGLDELVRRTVDVTSLPKAQGVLRDIQLAVVKMLLEVDKVCKEHKIQYWLDFGALLGAIRHKDFIPWDDDIDISMMREDYDKFAELFNQYTADKDLYVEKYYERKGKYNILKIFHKKFPTVFIDIFPYDFYVEKLDAEGKKALQQKIKQVKKTAYRKGKRSKEEQQKYRESFLKIRDTKIYEGKTPDVSEKPALFWGIDFNHTWPRGVFDYETMFPLSEVEFCGHKFPAPANVDLYLTTVYRDYMSLPSSLHYHTDLSQISVEEIMSIKKYAKGEL